MVAAKEHREDTDDRDITLAWRIAAMTRGTKGLPKLETLLHRKASRQQTVTEQIAMWQVAAARFGGQFRPRVTEVTSGR